MSIEEQIKETAVTGFKLSPHFENLVRLRDEQPKTFAILSPSEKIALGCYIQAKQKAQSALQQKANK